jgi:RNA polymerase sigma factor (sigma-70 family)
MQIAEQICGMIEPDLRFFILGSIEPSAARDVSQNTVRDIFRGIHKFEGDTNKQFWAWCYRIARNKISDYFRSKSSDRTLPMPPEELMQLVDTSAQDAPISPSVRLDLEYVLNMLTRSKPECYELLWQHYVFGVDYAEIASERSMSYDGVRMKIGRCLDEARKFID